MEQIKNVNNSIEDNTLFLIKSMIYSMMGIIFFFIPIKINNHTKTFLYHIFDKVQLNLMPLLKISLVICILLGFIKSIIVFKKEKKDIEILKMICKLISLLIIINICYGRKNVFLISEETLIIMEDIIRNLITILPVGAVFSTFLFDYGLLDIVESYTHSYMKNIFKLSGKSIINILLYIYTDFFVGTFMTYRLYCSGKLRENEVCILVLNFSIIGHGMINYVCSEFNISKIVLISLSFVILVIMNSILCRVYPLNKKKKAYLLKTKYRETTHKINKLNKGIDKYINNREDNKILKTMIGNLEVALKCIISILPKVIIFISIGDVIINNSYVISLSSYIIKPLLELVKTAEINELNSFIIYCIHNNILSVEWLNNNIVYEIQLLMGIIVLLLSISISKHLTVISTFSLNITITDLVILYLERVIIIVISYFIMYYFYVGYLQ